MLARGRNGRVGPMPLRATAAQEASAWLRGTRMEYAVKPEWQETHDPLPRNASAKRR